MNIKDIEGTNARPRHFTRPGGDATYQSMDYRDVTDVDFKTTRVVNPLEPSYLVRANDDKKEVCTIGPIDFNRPNVLPPPR